MLCIKTIKSKKITKTHLNRFEIVSFDIEEALKISSENPGRRYNLTVQDKQTNRIYPPHA